METIFVVTEGRYSDYHIVGVFDDEPLAKRCAELVGGTAGLYPINPERDRLNAGLMVWKVIIDLDSGAVNDEPDITGDIITDDPRLSTMLHGEPGHFLWLQVWARDAAHAVKIAGEKRREWLVTHPASVEYHDS